MSCLQVQSPIDADAADAIARLNHSGNERKWGEWASLEKLINFFCSRRSIDLRVLSAQDLSCMYERSIYHGRNMFVVHKNMTREKEREKERERERNKDCPLSRTPNQSSVKQRARCPPPFTIK
jgi:hypothetical protein